MIKHTLFVYGTLKKGCEGDINKYSPSPRLIGLGWVQGRLYDLGRNPALVLDQEAGPVWGEVYEIDESLYKGLDAWEAGCGDFQLESVSVNVAGTSIRSTVYVAGPTQTLPDQYLEYGEWPRPSSLALEEKRVFAMGERAILADFSHRDSAEQAKLAQTFGNALRSCAHPAITDIVEAPSSVTIHYRPENVKTTLRGSAANWMREFIKGVKASSFPTMVLRKHVIPVCYSPEFALDLGELASKSGISPDELIAKHSSATYTALSLGFLPGFAYLSGLPSKLRFARRTRPRAVVPAKSVAIADQFSGIYPEESPGGWHIIGRTPLQLFDPTRSEPSLIQAGDLIQFKPISLAEFEATCAT